MNQSYVFNECERIWIRVDSNPISYSDGEAVETYLLESLKNAKDLSCSSNELHGLIKDWPSEYHLSPVRHNLLRSFSFKASDRILELGCGCGSMTRYLGETGATVVAVEGSKRRAQITAERCRDLPNVKIYCDNLANFKTDEKFDYVTLIGVLEYAQLFIGSEDPVNNCLELANSFLKEDGVLILAIENKLGLKYFSGCREDHVGIPYFGINDLYTTETPVTFGKEEVAANLYRSGSTHLEFFYPFPDYKLPNLILSERGAISEKLNLKDLLIHAVSRDYPNNHHRAFAEGLAWGPIADNRLLESMANSFLIFAYKTTKPISKVDWLVKTYGRSHRKLEFQTETTIKPDNDALKVCKKYLETKHGNVEAADSIFYHTLSNSDYIYGHLLLRDIQLAVVREDSLATIAASFGPWLSYLQTHVILGQNGKGLLPGNFIDCIPGNLIINDAGEVKFFDAEWISKNHIPMAWVLVRGIIYSLNGCLGSRALEGITYRQLVNIILEVSLDNDDYTQADTMERMFSVYCHGSVQTQQSLLDIIENKIFLIDRLSESVPKSTSDGYKSELVRIKNTFSWRITAPLRIVWNIYRKLRGENVQLVFPKWF